MVRIQGLRANLHPHVYIPGPDLSFNHYNPIRYKSFTIISIFHTEEKGEVLVNVSHQYMTEMVLVPSVFWG